MSTITNIHFEGEFTWIYVVLALISLYLLFRKQESFNGEDIINSLIRLSNKIVLFWVSVTFLFMSFFGFIDPTNIKILNFFKDTLNVMIYYIILNYGTLYLLKLFNWCIEFVKENDLLYLSYFNKQVNRGNNKK